MATFTFNPADYTANDFAPIPVGDHRVRINDVVAKRFNSGNDGFELTLDVSGHTGKLWAYVVINPADPKKTNQRLGDFFNSFGITDYNLDHYRAWIGKIGGVRVKHEEYNGAPSAKVAFFLNKKNQDKLPAWKGETNIAATTRPEFVAVEEDDLPF